jgi:hypothetical protein
MENVKSIVYLVFVVKLMPLAMHLVRFIFDLEIGNFEQKQYVVGY